MDVMSYRPEPHELAWTFGGVPPVRRVQPGTVLELWSEDAFAGKVRGVDDLVSQVIEFPFLNPLTVAVSEDAKGHVDLSDVRRGPSGQPTSTLP